MVQESDFHADYIFTEGLELANLEMARRISHLKRHQWSVHEKGGCEVSDDTGGVIPPTSASNLQHEKDTPATPYLPPAIHHCPSSCSVSLFHLNPNQTSDRVTNGFNRSFQSNIHKSAYVFISAAVIQLPPGRECLFSIGRLFPPFLSMIKR